MTTTEIKNKITALSGSALNKLIADNWITAQSGLRGITGDDYRAVPTEDYPLQIICLMLSETEDFHGSSSAEKEITVERLKAAIRPIAALVAGGDLTLPTFSSVTALTPGSGDTSFFGEQLKEDFARLAQTEAEALATALYGVAYACFPEWDDWTFTRHTRTHIGYAFEYGSLTREAESEQEEAYSGTTGVAGTNASAAYTAVPVSRPTGKKIPGKWKPLKIYLIVTTLFVALVFGLVFLSMNSGVGASAMSIMDVNGQMVAIEPGMEPATLFLFGTVDYDGLIAGIKSAAIIFIVWRVVLITAVYIFNSRRRRRYHP